MSYVTISYSVSAYQGRVMRDIQSSQGLRDLKKLSVRHRYWLWQVAVRLTKVRGGYNVSFIPPVGEPTVLGPMLRKDLSKLNIQNEICRFLTQWFKGGDQMHAAFIAAIKEHFASNTPLGRSIVFHSNGSVTVD